MNFLVEFRSYNLKPGTRAAFHALFESEALPMLRRWNVDVVAYGASPHDDDSYYLIRAYSSLVPQPKEKPRKGTLPEKGSVT
jgi:hypothetical protein